MKRKPGGIEHYVTQVTESSGGPIAVSAFNGDLIVGNQVFSPEEEEPKKGKYVPVCQLADPAGPVRTVERRGGRQHYRDVCR